MQFKRFSNSTFIQMTIKGILRTYLQNNVGDKKGKKKPYECSKYHSQINIQLIVLKTATNINI